MRKQKVVLFGSHAPSLINFRGPLIADLAARGHKVFALAPGIDEALAARLKALGATPFSVQFGRTSLSPFGDLRTLRELRALFSRLRPDVVIAYTIKPILIGAAAARATGVARFVPLITGLGYAFQGGGEPQRRLLRALATSMYRRALRGAHVVLFQNEDDRGDFRRLGILKAPQRSAVVNGSGVDLDHFREQPLPAGVAFLMIARFLKDKGIREYGEAAARLKPVRPDLRMMLVGWADESPDCIEPKELEAMTAAGIECLGQLDDVRPALAQCSVYVLPSYREGTPRSVLEAMATGRAIVTTDAPGCRETVVDGENGWLVPPRDSEALYRAMLRFAEDPDLCAAMGAASRRLAEVKYDVHQVNQAILDHAGL